MCTEEEFASSVNQCFRDSSPQGCGVQAESGDGPGGSREGAGACHLAALMFAMSIRSGGGERRFKRLGSVASSHVIVRALAEVLRVSSGDVKSTGGEACGVNVPR